MTGTPAPTAVRALRVALAQINTVTGDIDSNTKKILRTLDHAADEGVDLVVFPELTLTGYPPRDLVDSDAFVDRNLAALADVAAHAKNVAAIVGHLERNDSSEGKRLFNAASLVHRGEITTVARKILLPTYDVFDETRWFQPGPDPKPHRFRQWELGVTICEDIWSTPLHGQRRLYNVDPVAMLVEAGAEVIINISASPYAHGRRRAKTHLFTGVAAHHRRPLILVNAVGGNDSLIFDGGSQVIDAEGNLVAQAPFFEESFDTVQVDDLPEKALAVPEETIGDVHRALVMGLRDYVRKCGFKRTVVGLSGGIDSAVTCALAAEALGSDAVTAITMPSMHSSAGSIEDSAALAETLEIEFHKVPIQPMVDAFVDALTPMLGDEDLGVTYENIQARARGVILMAHSNRTGALLLSTGNKSEIAVGYCTLYGDMAGGLAVLSDVPKTMVYQLADHINRHEQIIPQAIIDKPPSAELRPNQRDTDSLPPYDILDPIMRLCVEEHLDIDAIAERGFDRAVVARVIDLIARAEYKRRQMPPGLRVTSKAFGEGWRMPIAVGKMRG